MSKELRFLRLGNFLLRNYNQGGTMVLDHWERLMMNALLSLQMQLETCMPKYLEPIY